MKNTKEYEVTVTVTNTKTGAIVFEKTEQRDTDGQVTNFLIQQAQRFKNFKEGKKK